MRNICAIVLMTTGLALAGCSGSNSFGDKSVATMPAGQFSQVAQAQPVAVPSSAAATADKIFAKSRGSAPSDPSEYRIGPQDVLDITVMGVPELTRTAPVTSAGVITLPLVKQIKVKNRTAAEVEHEIGAKLSASYLQNPQVTVSVKEFNSQKVTVDGAVQQPGIFDKKGEMSLLQAIAQAKGLNTVADPTGVLIFRVVEGKRMAARYDIRQVRAGKSPDPMLMAGDVVMVDESAARTTLRDITAAVPLTGLFSVVPLL